MNTRAEWLEPPTEEEEGLRRYVETIRERLWLVVLTLVITTGIAIAYVVLAQKTYEATANLLVSPVTTDDAAIRSLPLIFESSDPTRDVETGSQFVSNTDVAATVRQRLDLSDSPRDLLKKVSVQPVAQSNIVAVTAKGNSPAEAQQLANTFARAAVDDRTTQVHNAIDAQLPQLQAQLQGAQNNPTVAATLGSELAQFQTLRNAQDPSFSVETLADAPQTPSAPRPALSIAAGLLGGLILGIAAAFVAQALDPRVRRETQLRRQYRLPILARIPRESKRRTKNALGPRQVSPPTAEAYRILRATLDASGANGQGGRVVLVTGSSPSEGKSTTAVNLASSLALAGNRVILIEADLRRPALATALDAQPRKGGVVGVLIENANFREALTPVPGYGPNLRALLAENEGGWIAELFSIPAAGQLVDEARRMADYVVIDSPPLNEVVDALPLARKADDVLIVVRLGNSRLEKIRQLGELLAESGVTPAGFCVVGVARPSRSGYRYYHRETPRDRARRARSSSPTG